MTPYRYIFQFIKIYPVFDPCKSWGRDVIPRSAGARGTMSTNKYLPYPTYIYLGNLWQHAGLNKQISCRSTSATSTTVHITSYLIVNVSPKNIQLTLFRKRLRLFLTHTSPIISSDEASWLPRYIMAWLSAWVGTYSTCLNWSLLRYRPRGKKPVTAPAFSAEPVTAPAVGS